jgi:uncharacterized protein YwqG
LDHLVKKYGLQGIASELRRHALPAIAFSLDDERTTRSGFGGAPLAPADFEWPIYTPPPRKYPPAVLKKLGISAPADPVPKPLDFLLQIDLADLRPFGAAAGIPARGLISFFYDTENQPWGFDPVHQGGFRVAMFDDEHLVALDPPHHPLEVRGLKFARGETLPHIGSQAYENLAAKVDLTDSYFDFLQEFEGQAYGQNVGRHRMFGHSANVQGDMQLEAQLVSNGLYCGDPSGYNDPRAAALAPGAADWVLLLQLDSDDRANIMWGDAGMLYFWIRRQDLAALRFDRTWLSLQCG